jgi:Flp pilus assembly protein TadD
LVFNRTPVLGESLDFNEYGNYLSWEYAKDSKDLVKIKKFIKKIKFENIEDLLLEEFLFESVILDEWSKAGKISSILLQRDKRNFSANLFKFFDGFVKGRDVDDFLEDIKTKHFDVNFLKAIMIWKNTEKNQMKLPEAKDCVPIICLHSGMYLILHEEHLEAQRYFANLEKKQFSSYRIKELLLLNAIDSEKSTANKLLDQLNKNDLNLKKFDLNYFSTNKPLLNPILNRKHGMSEVLYNISSWYFSKNLYKYSAFFGKLSLRLRPDFNAMKILLAGVFEQLGYKQLGIHNTITTNENNIYYYKFLKIQLAFLEDQKMNNEFLLNLKKFIEKYPEKIEMKILLADKHRRLEDYKKAIKVYSDIIENHDVSDESNVFYSRGISFERLNEWKKAEKDLKEALKRNPDDAYVMNYLAYSWLDRKKNIPEALELLERAVEIEPQDAYIVDSLGWAYFLSNNMKESIHFLEKAVLLLPEDATLNDHLGDAYWKAGRKDEALSQWKRVLIIDPEYKKNVIVNKKIMEGL